MEYEFLSSNKRFLKLLNALPSVAQSVSPVLIKGERGSGKEYIAKKMFESLSGTFCYERVLCKDDETFSIELEKLEKNDLECNVFVFFDEVANLSLTCQKNLLDFISLNKSNSKIKIVSSSCYDLEKLINRGSFNSELYKRLSSISIVVPSLRERKEDIIPLAQFFLEHYCEDMAKSISGFSPSVLKVMTSYWWPCNIREMKLEIEHSVLFCSTNRIELSDLSIADMSFEADDVDIEKDKSLKHAINTFKKRYVKRMLDECGWNKAKAARLLDVERTYIFKIINDFDIKNED